MRSALRRSLRWGLRILVALVLLATLHISALAFPYPLFPHRTESDCCTVYSDAELVSGLDEIMRDVDRRLLAVELHDTDKNNRVFYSTDQKRFTIVARMALVNPRVQGFNLSLLGTSYVSDERIRRLGASSGGFPPYGVRTGDPAHVIAHEIVHDYTSDALGILAYSRLAWWKREGYAEYGASIAAIRADGTASLADRIDLLLDDGKWWAAPEWVRESYRGALLVEYLTDIRGYRFAEIMSDRVTLDETQTAMLRWRSDQ